MFPQRQFRSLLSASSMITSQSLRRSRVFAVFGGGIPRRSFSLTLTSAGSTTAPILARSTKSGGSLSLAMHQLIHTSHTPPIRTPVNRLLADRSSVRSSFFKPVTRQQSDTSSPPTGKQPPSPPSNTPVPKKSLWARVKAEAEHYWLGTRLLAKEISISTRLLSRVGSGIKLTRREHAQV
eukprot:Partr_v1_DN28855_c0_g1_i5_m33842